MMERKPVTPEVALERLEALCARSEHCEYEMRTKLRGWGIAGADADRIVDSLVAHRFVDDARFAEAFVNDKWRFAGHGRLKIRLALAAKRIDRDIIADALDNIDDEAYRERLEEILRAKARSIADVDTYEGRTKLYRYGASRGFEPPLVAAVIKDIFRKQ